MVTASKEEVLSFLKKYRNSFREKRGMRFIPRWEGDGDAMSEIGETNATSEILHLGLSNYSKGPEPDRTVAGEVWIFGKVIGDEEHYIKIKISPTNDSPTCLSFKKSTRTITYPYAES